MKKNLIKLLKILTIVIIFSLGFSYSFAWTAPTGLVTINNTIPSINLGIINQAKGIQPSTIPSLLDIEGILSSNVLAIFGKAFVQDYITISAFDKAHNPTVTYPASVCINDNGTLYLCYGSFLYTLDVQKIGTGVGYVLSDPSSGIDCGINCSYDYPLGQSVTLKAGSLDDSFVGWGGACSGTVLTCVVSMTDSKFVTANFSDVTAIKPTLTTSLVVNLTQNSATSGGNISSDGGATITSSGIVWGRTSSPTITTKDGITSNGGTTGSFSSNMTGLLSNTTYYVRAYATNFVGTSYGANVSFKTATSSSFMLSIIKDGSGVVNITSSPSGINCGAGCFYSYSSGTNVTLTALPEVGSSITGVTGCSASWDVSTGEVTCSVLMSSAKTVSYQTSTIVATVPEITTVSPVTDITQTTANGGGNITANGGAPITTRGVVWSTTVNPTVSLSTKTTDGSGSGSFTSNILGLTANTTYHLRAYATNVVGTGYGNDVLFKTPDINTFGLRVDKGGTGDGVVTSSPMGIDCGVDCYQDYYSGTSVTLTPLADAESSFVSWSGCTSLDVFKCIVVMNSSKKPIAVFNTNATIATTSPVASINQNSGTGGGTISGVVFPTQRGLVISNSANPTINGVNRIFTTGVASGNGTFAIVMDGLSPGTKYHVRAFLIKNTVIYGNDVSFTTSTPI